MVLPVTLDVMLCLAARGGHFTQEDEADEQQNLFGGGKRWIH